MSLWMWFLIASVATAGFAQVKGFNPIAYFLAGGPLGLGLLAALPSPKKAGTSESGRARREVGDKLGYGLSGVTAAVLLVLMIVL